jgi:type II secretory pathway predicted ATPase ExeA/septal ring-binding cell division protein DamX
MSMYLEHFGLTEAPFKITPHTEFFFSGASRGETLEALLYSITSGEGIVKVTGEVGAGKTMLCRVLMERLPPSVETIYLAVPSLSRDEMLATIAGDLDLETQGMSTTKLIRALQEKLIEIHAEGRQVVALIDEAHAMPLETLEEIRLLSNLETSHFKLMQIVLFGQPELDQHLSLQNMRQLRERITHSFTLLPLPPRDIKDYVDFRLRAAGYKGPDLFTADPLRLIAEASEGLTRRINIYCDKTLLAAFAAGTHTVTPDLVRAAITDTQIVVPDTNKRRGAIWLATLASLIAGLVIGFLAGRAIQQETAPFSMDARNSAPIATAQPTIAPAQPLPPSPSGSPPPAAVVPAVTPAATPALPSTTPTTGAGDAPVAAAAIDKTPAPPAAADTPPATKPTPGAKDWLGARVAADMARIEKQPRGRYSIQLMTADERERSAIETYLRAASRDLDPDRVMVYLSGTAENPKVSVLYGNYADRTEATAELSSLPQKLNQSRPYARSFQAIRDDIRKPAP